MQNLEEIIKNKQKGIDSISDSDIISSLSKFETYVQEAYEGRLFFELIQNARDAAFQKGINSDIKVIVKNDQVFFANTGKPFDEKGIIAMTRLGISNKRENGLIGSKGIGFKSIQEYTKKIRIITEFGTLYFDKEELTKKLQLKFPETFSNESYIPLFYYPLFDKTKNYEIPEFKNQIFDTIIEFQINRDKNIDQIIELYDIITDEELVLLGYINSIEFVSDTLNKKRIFNYKENNSIELNNNGQIRQFKVLTPSKPIEINEDVYQKLEENEKIIYEHNKKIDIRIVFECDNQNNLILKKASKLFLYYPLEDISGFPYVIHSNFSCNPERTSIRNTVLNNFIFDQLSTIQSNDLIAFLKNHGYKEELIDYLCYEKNISGKFNQLYMLYNEKLKSQKIIWIEDLQDFVCTSEIVICPDEIYHILKNHKVDNKYLYSNKKEITDFLYENFGVPTLTVNHILKHCEEFCQKETSNPTFFSKLYNILVHNNINCSNKKILLGANSNLYSSIDDVFYSTDPLNFEVPIEINTKIIKLHPEIAIKTENELKYKELLGLKKLNKEELVKKAQKLFSEIKDQKKTVLTFLFNLYRSYPNLKEIISKKIYIPIIGDNTMWYNPLYVPIYFDFPKLKELYPNGKFVDLESVCDGEELKYEWINFFKDCGVWEIPALYYSLNDVYTDKETTQLLQKDLNKPHLNIFKIKNDRIIDFPEKTNYYFFTTIIKNWSLYLEKIKATDLLEYRYYSNNGISTFQLDNIESTSFIRTLKSKPWIYLSEDQFHPFKIDEIVAINKLEVNTDKSIHKFLNVLILDNQINSQIINHLKIKHLNAYSPKIILSILNDIHLKFKNKENQLLDVEFKRFYHSILKYLYQTFIQIEDSNEKEKLINSLKDINFLCQIIKGKEAYANWQKPDHVIHIDDRQNFEIIPTKIIEHLGYFFTKSDKNEIGKVFSRIGKKLSNEIRQEPILSENLNETYFLNEIKNLSYIIVAVEDKINEHLKPENFKTLQETTIVFNKTIKRNIYLASNKDLSEQVLLEYFYDDQNNIIHLKFDYYQNLDENIIGEICNNIFGSITGKDLNITRLCSDLQYSKHSLTFHRALKDIEFDYERILEIENLFFKTNLSLKQRFWNSLIKVKLKSDEDYFKEYSNEINFESLSKVLNSDCKTLEYWNCNFDYKNLSSTSNFNYFKDILEAEKISLDELNSKLEYKISLENIYFAEFELCRNNNINQIKQTLFKYYSDKPLDKKMEFYKALNDAEKLFPNEFNNNPAFNVAFDLVELLNSKYSGLNLTIEKLENTLEEEWLEKLMSIDLKISMLREKINALNIGSEKLSSFINLEKNYSLLFFEEYENLLKKYVDYTIEPNFEFTENILNFSEFNMLHEDNQPIISCGIASNSYNDNILSFKNEVVQISKNSNFKAHQNSVSLPKLANPDFLKHIGQEGERLVFLKLNAKYPGKVTWVSENASCMNFLPEKEALGYDMRFIDDNNETHYVEVKSSSHQNPEFYITINEIKSAIRHGKNYHIYWITNLLNDTKRAYYDLGNLFINFEEGQDIFQNNRYYPEITGFKISFQPESIDIK